jgi:hypothetical protein
MTGYGYGSSEENQPVTWLRGYPVYAAHLIVLVYVVSMLVTTLIFASGGRAFLDWFAFSSSDVFRGELWRIGTYGLINPPSIWFVIDMFMIVWFGRELEKFFGRRTFLTLYGCIYFISPLLLTAIGVVRPTFLSGQTGGFALFVAFATLYPNVSLLFNILAKWTALILVGIFTLIAFAAQDWVSLMTLWGTSGLAFVFVRYQQGVYNLPKIRFRRREPKLRVLPDPKIEKTPKPVRTDSVRPSSMAEIDALLDKIAHSGMASLTAKERAKLDAAREDLLKKSSGQ